MFAKTRGTGNTDETSICCKVNATSDMVDIFRDLDDLMFAINEIIVWEAFRLRMYC